MFTLLLIFYLCLVISYAVAVFISFTFWVQTFFNAKSKASKQIEAQSMTKFWNSRHISCPYTHKQNAPMNVTSSFHGNWTYSHGPSICDYEIFRWCIIHVVHLCSSTSLSIWKKFSSPPRLFSIMSFWLCPHLWSYNSNDGCAPIYGHIIQINCNTALRSVLLDYSPPHKRYRSYSYFVFMFFEMSLGCGIIPFLWTHLYSVPTTKTFELSSPF